MNAAKVIAEADAIVITAGAGMGVDSGLPDFRGNKGFWKSYPVAERLGLSFADLANPHQFEDNPRLVWAFYSHRLNLYRNTTPHKGFAQLLELCNARPRGYFVFTSNVDGQFQKAGFDPFNIVECHGSIHRQQCASRCHDDTWPVSSSNIAVDEETFTATGTLPKCRQCGDIARPNILMFDDFAWVPKNTDEQMQRMYQWWRGIVDSQAKVAVIEIGSGTAIATVRKQSESMAGYAGATLIRINPGDSQVPAGNLGLPMAAKEAIDSLMDEIEEHGGFNQT